MDIKVSKYSKFSTIGVNGHTGECVACRFYCFKAERKDGDDVGRVKVHCDTGEPDFKKVAAEFKKKNVTVTAEALKKAFDK